MYFIAQIKRKKADGAFVNVIMTKSTEDEAFQCFYASMSTYAYDQTYDFVMCYVMYEDGRIIKNDRVDRRDPEPQPEA